MRIQQSPECYAMCILIGKKMVLIFIITVCLYIVVSQL